MEIYLVRKGNKIFELAKETISQLEATSIGFIVQGR